MSTCWKCGRETPPNVTECEDCENGGAEDQIEAALNELDRRGIKFQMLDWSKVVTLEDYKILTESLLHPLLAIPTSHPRFEQLKKFLKPSA